MIYTFFFCFLLKIMQPFMQDVSQTPIFNIALKFQMQNVQFQVLSFAVSHQDLETFSMNKTWPFSHLGNTRNLSSYNLQVNYFIKSNRL